MLPGRNNAANNKQNKTEQKRKYARGMLITQIRKSTCERKLRDDDKDGDIEMYCLYTYICVNPRW